MIVPDGFNHEALEALEALLETGTSCQKPPPCCTGDARALALRWENPANRRVFR
jgi:hypothetical protein